MDARKTNNYLTGEDAFFVISIFIYIIGLSLHAKIILISKKEKWITWKLDVANSSLIIVHYANIILIHTTNIISNGFHVYTGAWFCYTSSAMVYYGVLYVTGHTFVVALMKYFIIVQWKFVRSFGKERIKEIFFWLNLLHPLFMILLHLIVRPTFFRDFGGFAKIDGCNFKSADTTAKGNLLSFRLCSFTTPHRDNYLDYTYFVFRTLMCGFQTILLLLIAGNVLEVILYGKIFRFSQG